MDFDLFIRGTFRENIYSLCIDHQNAPTDIWYTIGNHWKEFGRAFVGGKRCCPALLKSNKDEIYEASPFTIERAAFYPINLIFFDRDEQTK
ncbi:MAG: hypothetical protein WC346_16930 [Methanogenium sp.]